MKTCPDCGKKFNWWQRAIGENREHIRNCSKSAKGGDKLSLAAGCRGCPAGCFEGMYDKNQTGTEAQSKDKR
ncbi:MAG TPA: hypothetical protein ENH01_04890 [Nitrospirae bacterium]|nr:hypothetical protein [Nitrospirota bacterium]